MTKNAHTFRDLTTREQGIIDRLLEKAFPGRDEICEQMKKCLVRTIDEDESLEFLVKSDVKAKVKRRIPVSNSRRGLKCLNINALFFELS